MMHAIASALLLHLAISVIANLHGHDLALVRHLDADKSASSSDLAQITDAPGPPTIQPGIPALQPSIPTSGVASLSIPPVHQTSFSKSFSEDNSVSDTFLISFPTAATTPTSFSPIPATVGSVSGPSSTATSIPFLSELMSQIFSSSSPSTIPSIPATFMSSSSVTSRSSTPETSFTSGKTVGLPTSPAIVESDPKDGLPTPPMSSILVYSFQLPPYTGGLDTSGIAETTTMSPSVGDKTNQPSEIVYSYSLPPYTPKVPTYVATSAGTAPVSLTAGVPGAPTANAPTHRIFLQQGSVNPAKDVPAGVISTIIPLYSPACLGNAYGGGYVITPTISGANSNATGIANIPPAYGFSYKLEPTQSPAYSAAVIIADTKVSMPTVGPSPIPAPAGGDTSALAWGGSPQFGVITQTPSPSMSAPFGISLGSVTPSLATVVSYSGPEESIHTAGPVPASMLSIIPAQGTAPNASVGNASCTTITMLATSSYLVNAAGSIVATLKPQNQILRAAVESDDATADTTNAPAMVLGSPGASSRPRKRIVGAIVMSLLVCFMVLNVQG
ncbi:MAG: hypothetical protein Q9170_006629 [Blastenia crenularia]